MAVLVRLDDAAHEQNRGRWYLEAGFGPLHRVDPPPFGDLGEAEAWLRVRLGPSGGLAEEGRASRPAAGR